MNNQSNENGMGGILKWIIPLLIIGAGIWFFTKDGLTEKSNDIDSTEQVINDNNTSSSDQSPTSERPSTSSSNTNAIQQSNNAAPPQDRVYMDDNGNIVDGNGKILAAKGEYKEMDGYYVDRQGKKIGLLSKIGSAVSGAATKTADGFKKVFSKLFKGKEKIGSTYLLTQIEFDNTSHKIIDFSKGEVEGLAAALKEMPDAKIKVRVYSNDGKDDKENKEFTTLRANVVHDMLVTLGVKENQISFEGMGKKDAVKAAAEKVEIKLEQTAE